MVGFMTLVAKHYFFLKLRQAALVARDGRGAQAKLGELGVRAKVGVLVGQDAQVSARVGQALTLLRFSSPTSDRHGSSATKVDYRCGQLRDSTASHI